VGRAFLDSVSADSEAARVMGLLWREARFLRVERRPPLTTASGKILHLHASTRRRAPDGRLAEEAVDARPLHSSPRDEVGG
jgi:hypothetical protein